MKNDKKLWFKAKRYGYGWYPSTWQGWGVMVVYFIIHAGLMWFLNKDIENNMSIYLILILITTGLLIWVSYKKGEPAKWRWGK